ncbi:MULTISPECIES: ionic transporter y4hA [unclassified Undibacterium]|uniref:calcium:proton antiporter n=1 Tax=unclassified Undibacterium TaxID=2630295 RepID=UPI002AC9BB81|nr:MULTISPECIES: ionic transporter y4hA [unclassified Undibacterium]MEB0140272.1 ionic transporter y4hA [Undibacterium sp. CCC2.1]MEB0173314.1 ionic transporter y4hA [Undibacterium sp. CCC1.1]MEB0177133.1 ionic transporter y4hA [Undibacterium sp. CCC3.4]MEB0216411.1 ionic transporter y4hA [Undibacterium sp. 5I2]WPX45535.1 ionic transporter y4hA [Undibacterium sp. CCC3.4]
MIITPTLPRWSLLVPVLCWVALAGVLGNFGAFYPLVLTLALFGGVLTAVYHAEIVAYKIGEPFGTLLLALAVTLIEVALIVSLMLAGGEVTAGLARDTVFAAIMVILTGIIGLCLLFGGIRHGEQSFGLQGASTALATLAALAVLTLVLPNFTSSVSGPHYSQGQLAFIAVVSLALYGTFVLVQTVRHRDYFLPEVEANDEAIHAPAPSTRMAWSSAGLLIVCLVVVVLLAKALAPSLEAAVAAAGAPKALVGIIIAIIVLLPEGIAALSAARANRLQTSINLALGSALASIGLTIPVVAVISLLTGWQLSLGIDQKSTVLLLLSLFVTTISLGTGRTTIMQGTIHLVIFAVYLFTTVIP